MINPASSDSARDLGRRMVMSPPTPARCGARSPSSDASVRTTLKPSFPARESPEVTTTAKNVQSGVQRQVYADQSAWSCRGREEPVTAPTAEKGHDRSTLVAPPTSGTGSTRRVAGKCLPVRDSSPGTRTPRFDGRGRAAHGRLTAPGALGRDPATSSGDGPYPYRPTVPARGSAQGR
jgi:hypothetical protein